MKLVKNTIEFSDDVQRDEAIETLVANRMSGVKGQKDNPSLILKFSDEETAKQALDILKSNINETYVRRLQELAGVQLNESGLTRTVVANITDDIIKQATKMVKPAYRDDKRKVQEYITELMSAIHDELDNKGFEYE